MLAQAKLGPGQAVPRPGPRVLIAFMSWLQLHLQRCKLKAQEAPLTPPQAGSLRFRGGFTLPGEAGSQATVSSILLAFSCGVQLWGGTWARQLGPACRSDTAAVPVPGCQTGFAGRLEDPAEAGCCLPGLQAQGGFGLPQARWAGQLDPGSGLPSHQPEGLNPI